MADKRTMQQFEDVAEAIGGLLLTAVEATITERSPEPARAAIEELLDVDERAAPASEAGPTQVLALLLLAHWLTVVRDELAERPERVAEVLGWIEENLGRRYRARARYTSGVLENEAAAEEIGVYQPALQEDFAPTLLWLLAGAVARYGDGDLEWLRALDAHAPAGAGLTRSAAAG